MGGLKEIISAHPFFKGMKPEHLDIIARDATVVKIETEQFLFREGEPADKFYLIESGRIALEVHEPADGTALIEYLGAGDVLGWSWLFPPFVWHLQARIVEPTRLIVLSGAHLLVAAERNHEFGYQMMKRIAQLVIHRLQAARQQLLVDHIEAALEG